MSATLTRRAIVAGAATALGSLSLPGIVAAAPVESFDPAAFLADLKSIGCRSYAFRDVALGGAIGPWRYGIGAPEGGFGDEFDAIMRRWSNAPGTWPEKHERVAAYIVGSPS